MTLTAIRPSAMHSDLPPKCERPNAVETIRAALIVDELYTKEIDKNDHRCLALLHQETLNIIHDIETACAYNVDDQTIQSRANRSMIELSSKVEACIRSEPAKEEKQKSKSALEVLKDSLKNIQFNPLPL